jgi:hypothetical protein
LQRLDGRFDIWTILARGVAPVEMRDGDVMDNIGEMARHTDVNGRLILRRSFRNMVDHDHIERCLAALELEPHFFERSN